MKARADLVRIHPRSFRSLFLVISLPLVYSIIHCRPQSILKARRSGCRCGRRFRGLLRCTLARSWCTHYRLSLEVIRIHLVPVYLVHFRLGACFRRRSSFDRCSSGLRGLSKSSPCTGWIGFLRRSRGDVEFILPFEELAFLWIVSILWARVECPIGQLLLLVHELAYLPGFFVALPATNLEHTRLCPCLSILVNVSSESAHGALDHAIFIQYI